MFKCHCFFTDPTFKLPFYSLVSPEEEKVKKKKKKESLNDDNFCCKMDLSGLAMDLVLKRHIEVFD